jgi:hypothetical protein
MPKTSPGYDAAGLTGLMTEFGAMWQITATPHGYQAQRRPRTPPPVILSAATVTALRELIRHGYDPAALAALMRDLGPGWVIERIDPGTIWAAIPRDDPAQIITAPDLPTLAAKISQQAGQHQGL